jgi:hypothetical protein
MPLEKWPWYGENEKEYTFLMYRWGKLPNDVPGGVYVWARAEGLSYAGLFIGCGKSPDDVVPRSNASREQFHILNRLADKHCTHVGVHIPQGDDTAESVLADIEANSNYDWPVARERLGPEMKWEG